MSSRISLNEPSVSISEFDHLDHSKSEDESGELKITEEWTLKMNGGWGLVSTLRVVSGAGDIIEVRAILSSRKSRDILLCACSDDCIVVDSGLWVGKEDSQDERIRVELY